MHNATWREVLLDEDDFEAICKGLKLAGKPELASILKEISEGLGTIRITCDLNYIDPLKKPTKNLQKK